MLVTWLIIVVVSAEFLLAAYAKYGLLDSLRYLHAFALPLEDWHQAAPALAPDQPGFRG